MYNQVYHKNLRISVTEFVYVFRMIPTTIDIVSLYSMKRLVFLLETHCFFL
jgi:ABC-type maltose transport system permease subunit